jgi:Mg-chelatase subunit ChlD
MSDIAPSVGGGEFQFPGLGGGRRHSSRRGKGKGKGRGRKGGSFLAEITVPAALLAATQYMKGPSSYRRTKRRGSRRRNKSSQRRRRR